MATKYKLSYTGQEINEKLGKIDNLVSDVADLKEKNAPSYTNSLSIAINADGSLYTATDAEGNIIYGYKENYRLNSNGEEDPRTNYYITGFIPVKKGDTLRFKELDYMSMDNTAVDSGAIKICFYLSDFSFSTGMDHSPSNLPSDAWSPVFRNDGNVEQMTIPTVSWYDNDISYMRLCAKKITNASIITINEPIPEDEIEIRVADLEARVEVLENGTSPEVNAIPSYWKIALDEGVEVINTTLCEAGRNKSAFLFYTDAHWNYGSQMSPRLLKYLYNHTGMTKTFFGGDIVNNEADDYDTMKYLWDWRNQLKDLPNHYSVVGNHDDGNTTDNLFDEKFVYGYLQAAEETSDIVRGEQGLYYYIDNPSEKTRYLFLDTAFQNIYYHDDQKEFVTNTLLTTPDGWHIVAIAHIWYQTDYTVNPPVPKEPSIGGAYLLEQFDNYNSRVGQFADCGGWVEFCIGGHTHWDFDATSTTGIPIVLVETDSKHVRSGLGYTAGTTTEASVNGIVADYDAKIIHVIRVGRGESRDIVVGGSAEPDEPVTPDIPEGNYINVLKTAIDTDGSLYNGGKGYKDNYIVDDAGAEAQYTGLDTTGYIAAKAGDVIRFKNVTYKIGNNMNVVRYRSTFEFHSFTSFYKADTIASWSPVYDDNDNIVQLTIPSALSASCVYFRFNMQDINENSIITVNEEIG